MAAHRINDALRSIDLDEVEPLLLRDDSDGDPEPIEVCTATLDDWNCYVLPVNQAMKPKFMEWHDNKIWIVEYPGTIHSAASAAVLSAMVLDTGTGDDDITPHYNPHSERPPAGEPNIEPDCAFGPRDHVGAVLPPEMTCWGEYHTMKMEVGLSQGWPGLDRKAALWKGRLGVEFVLSIRLPPALRDCEYRLERRVGGQFPDGDNRAPIFPINANVVLEFDAHQLLGIPADAALPGGFNDPVRINLFDRVERIRRSVRVVRQDGENEVNATQDGGTDHQCSVRQRRT